MNASLSWHLGRPPQHGGLGPIVGDPSPSLRETQQSVTEAIEREKGGGSVTMPAEKGSRASREGEKDAGGDGRIW